MDLCFICRCRCRKHFAYNGRKARCIRLTKSFRVKQPEQIENTRVDDMSQLTYQRQVKFELSKTLAQNLEWHHYKNGTWPCGLMDKALVFGTKDCRFESCQGHHRSWGYFPIVANRIATSHSRWGAVAHLAKHQRERNLPFSRHLPDKNNSHRGTNRQRGDSNPCGQSPMDF